MTTTEICAAARAFAPRIQLRDVWFVLRQMQQRNLARCLNPRHVTGKLCVLTIRGRRVIHEAFGLNVPAEAKGLDWRRYPLHMPEFCRQRPTGPPGRCHLTN